MNEQQFITKFQKWVKNKWKYGSFVFEAKVCKSDRLNIKQNFHSHQVNALSLVNSNLGLFYKIPDEGQLRKPFDGFFLRNVLAYWVIWWDKYKEFHMIREERLYGFILNMKLYKTKSLTYEISKLILSYSGKLK